MSGDGKVLAAGLVIAVLAACRPGEVAKSPKSTAPMVAPTPSSTVPSKPPAPSAANSGTPATAPTPPPAGPLKPVVPSAMGAKLREIGLDPAALPPLNKLDPKTLRDVMNTFTKALGVQCSHCHEKDFKVPTAKKTIATHMWNDFTRTFALDGDGTLYCDSCHQGSAHVLGRRDVQTVAEWMQTNFVDKLKRADKKEHGCDTCHSDPFEGKILASWK